ncbi:hypothetical protein pipiens_019812 [Culex pipiens pipiens]|uniref:Reverse transcriptase domain-containing protein n=1 Tax=Culex pipiens pipiens TaxID=38569 RepID=A0ABD1DR94_CULPP
MKGRNLGRCSISQFKWLESLYEAVTEGQDIPLLPESTPPVSIPAPTVGEIRAIIANFRNSTSPGSDMINVELLKKAPDEFVEKLHELIAVVWNSNVPPADFIDTVQVPIPKKPSPKATTDFRKITLCNVVYKVIATHLLYKLDEVTGELPTYQAAFLANRSVEDHIFTSKRITEEYWNHGISLYALALDIRQAFDSVSHAAVIEALQTLGVPNFLVNRRTPKVSKGKGVKQGCPLSPRLFTLVLHWILLKLKQLHPSVNLEHSVGMKPPFILAYADDLMIITSSLKEMDEIMWSLRSLLEEVGLIIHPEKTELLIRDPYETKDARLEQHIVGGFHLTSKASVRYLGAYLTATVNRPESVKRRCSQGSRVSKAILPFLKKNRVPWDIARRIYRSVVVPTVVFGLNAISLTAGNRRTLRHFERKTVQEWYKACGGVTIASTRSLLLKKTIIKTIVINRVTYWGHISRRMANHLLQAAFNLKIELPKRKCRPCDTWMQTLEKELAVFGKVKEDFVSLLLDKAALKKEVRKIYLLPEASDSEDESDDN